MTPHKIQSIIALYKHMLEEFGTEPKRIDPKCKFSDYIQHPHALQQHALYLIHGLEHFVLDTKKQGRANRHLTAIQMCLSFAGIYTLEQLMNHNRPD